MFEGMELLRYRQKLVKIADSSELGWRVVQEYTANPLADDSEDDKKILRAQTRISEQMLLNLLQINKSVLNFRFFSGHSYCQ
jgi:hypothetical protein